MLIPAFALFLGDNLYKAKEEKKKNMAAGLKRRSKEKGSESKGVKFDQFADKGDYFFNTSSKFNGVLLLDLSSHVNWITLFSF